MIETALDERGLFGVLGGFLDLAIMKARRYAIATGTALLLLVGCTTPEKAVAKRMTPRYQALDQQFRSKQISQKSYVARRQALNAEAYQYYAMLRANQERRRQAALAFASGMNAASQNFGQSSYAPSSSSFAASAPRYSNPYANRYDPNSLSNPYGAGSPYKADGLMNPYSQYGSRYSDKSWTNPYATNAPKLYDSNGRYLGRFSSNPYDPDSTSNPYGRYGSKYSPTSINNPYGAGNPYSSQPVYVAPQP